MKELTYFKMWERLKMTFSDIGITKPRLGNVYLGIMNDYEKSKISFFEKWITLKHCNKVMLREEKLKHLSKTINGIIKTMDIIEESERYQESKIRR